MYHKIFSAAAVAIALTSFSFTPASFAHEYKLGDLIIDHPVVRATAPGAKVSGGYLVIVNTGETDDRLTGVAADFAAKSEVHEIKMQGDVMMMKALPDGLSIPAGATVELKPGSFHLMFMKLKEALETGDKHKSTLTFEKAGSIDVMFKVKSIANTMKMKHDSGS